MGGFIAALFGMFLLLLSSGMWMGIAAALVGIFISWSKNGFDPMLSSVSWLIWNSASSYSLAVIPLFVFMGFMLMECGLAARIYDSVEPLLDHFPGGLLHTNVVVGALFAAANGSSTASAALLGSVSLPEMERRGYPFGISVGSVAAGALLAPLIPPSVIMIFYCMVTSTSIGKEFIAGMFPGLMLAALFILYIAGSLLRHRQEFRPSALPWGKCLMRTRDTWLILVLIVLVLGSIYGGIATPTEAAGVGSVGVIALAAVSRCFSWKALKISVTKTMELTCQLMFIYFGITIMSSALAMVGVIDYITKGLLSLTMPPMGVLLIILGIFFILGFFLEGIPIVLLVVPIVFPAVVHLGFNPVWFGILVVLICNTGNLTPPVGITLFVLQILLPKRPVVDIYRGMIPFIAVVLVTLAIQVIFPQISLWLPNTMIGE